MRFVHGLLNHLIAEQSLINGSSHISNIQTVCVCVCVFINFSIQNWISRSATPSSPPHFVEYGLEGWLIVPVMFVINHFSFLKLELMNKTLQGSRLCPGIFQPDM